MVLSKVPDGLECVMRPFRFGEPLLPCQVAKGCQWVGVVSVSGAVRFDARLPEGEVRIVGMCLTEDRA